MQGFLLQVEISQIIVHETGEPNALVDFFDTKLLSCQHDRNVDPLAMQAEATAGEPLTFSYVALEADSLGLRTHVVVETRLIVLSRSCPILFCTTKVFYLSRMFDLTILAISERGAEGRNRTTKPSVVLA